MNLLGLLKVCCWEGRLRYESCPYVKLFNYTHAKTYGLDKGEKVLMKKSDKILKGIYLHIRAANKDIPLSADELFWLFKNDPKKWKKGDKFQKNEGSQRFDNVSFVERELSLLKAKSYLDFERPKALEKNFKITILPMGICRAQQLSTILGCVDLFYRDNKSGIFGIVLTILISATTSLVVSLLSD